MNGDDVKTINKSIGRNTAVSIGVVVSIVIGVAALATIIAKQGAVVEAHIDAPLFHENMLERLENDYVQRGELNQRLLNIERSIMRIENVIIN